MNCGEGPRPDIRVGVIGTGFWGMNLCRNFAALGALAAVYDANPAVRGALPERFPGTRCHTSLGAVVGDATLDAVAIATPAATHEDIAMQALASGKHVFVEKPMCLDVDAAARLISEAERRNLRLMVGHLLLYHPAFEALHAAVRGGAVGELRYIYSNRLSLGRIRREENSLWSFAPHDVSMILQLVGAMPVSVVTNGEAYLSDGVADTTLSHLMFSAKLQAHIFVSWLHPFKDHRLVVVGGSGMAVFNDSANGAEKLLLYRHKAEWQGDVPVVSRADAEPIPYDYTEPLRLECQHFIAAIAQGTAPRSDGAEGQRVLRVLDACARSLRSGRAVAVT